MRKLRFTEKANGLLLAVFPYTAALFLGFIFLRIYEYAAMDTALRPGILSLMYCLLGMATDLMLALVITGIFLLFRALLTLVRVRLKPVWLGVISLLALIINFILVEYFLATKIPLDETIYFFSLSELKIIVGSGDRFSLGIVAIFCLLLLLFSGSVFLFRKQRTGRIFPQVFGSMIILSVLFGFLTHSIAGSDPHKMILVNNRLAYFTQRSVVCLFADKDGSNANIKVSAFRKLDPNFYGGTSVSREYPLLHELENTSGLSAFLNKSEKGAPNIVFIIVESLSTTLVGEKGDKTGNLLPFLDSLSEQSLYWPNFLSTCDRTHNVLPAALASVPYTTKGNLFQQLEFPDHWSLMTLLKNDYFSRFYCGVDLNFSNMNGFMNHNQTGYVVKNWEKQFGAKFSERDSPWGYPDGAMFGKSWLDYDKQHLQGRKRMDIFLTISTHDPFVVPREKYYTDLVLQRINKIRKPTEVHQYVKQNAYKFASFVYLDDQLKKYFEEARKKPDFDNTIFLIFGDHGTELCLYDDLSRYRIPLIIYSPLIKKPHTFRSVASQLDLAPTLLNYLRKAYDLELPSTVPFLGKELSYDKQFRSDRSLILGTSGLKEEHLIHKDYFMFHDQLYRVKKDLNIERYANDEVQREMSSQRKMCNLMADYTIYGNKIIPDFLNKSYVKADEFKQVYQYGKSKLSAAELSAEYINIGEDRQLPQNTRFVRITFECDYWNDDKQKTSELPALTLSLENKTPGKEKLLFWKQIDYHQYEKFRQHAWNHLSATLTVRMEDYEKLDKNNIMKFYVLNSGGKYFNIKNIETKVFTNR